MVILDPGQLGVGCALLAVGIALICLVIMYGKIAALGPDGNWPTDDEDANKPGIKYRNRPANTGCMKLFGIVFYGLLMAQLMASLCIVGLGNRKIVVGNQMLGGGGGDCPEGMIMRSGWEGCITDALNEQVKACDARRLQTFGPVPRPRQRNMWEAMEEEAQVPAVLLAVCLVLVPLWLLTLRKCTAGVVYTSLLLDLALLVYLAIRTEFAWPMVTLLILFLLGCGYAFHRKMIQKAIEILHVTMVGLCETPQVFGACFLIFYLYVSYAIVWMLGLLASPNVLEVSENFGCQLRESANVASLRTFMIFMFPITTLFFMNAKMVVCSCALGSWYFKSANEQPKSPAYVGLRWAFFESAGPVFAASLVMEAVRRLRKLAMRGCWGVHWLCDPTGCGCCLRLIWCCVGQMLAAFSRFMLVAHVFHGGGVIETGKNAYKTLKNHLGQAVVTDSIASSVVKWSTTIFSAGLGIAAWIWMEQELDAGWLNDFLGGAAGVSKIVAEMAVLGVILMMIWIVSMPIVSLTILGLVGSMVSENVICGMLTGFFVGCITNVVFTFIGEIVHNSSDAIMYCFALEAESGNKQERFEELYKTIKGTVCEGVPEGDVNKVVEGNVVDAGDAR